MVGSVIRLVVDFTRASYCCSKSVRLGYDVVRQYTAVAPPSNSKSIGVGDIVLNQVIDGCNYVIEILVAPVSPDSPRKFKSIAG